MRKIWLLKLVPGMPYGRLISCGTIFTLLYLYFYFGTTADIQSPAVGLFFCLIIAYIIPVFSFITEKSLQAFDELQPIITLTSEEFERLRRSVDHRSMAWFFTSTGLGLILAFAHLWLMEGLSVDVLKNMTGQSEALIGLSGIIIIWVVMTTVIFALLGNAILLATLGARHLQIKILETGKLLPIARVAVFSTLSLIGALAFFPVMILDSEITLVALLPGLIATAAPIIVLLVVPVWPVHKRILALKNRELIAINKELDSRTCDSVNVLTDYALLENLVPILMFRREVAGISTWPFDIGALTRLGFYLVIPPLTWVAAALIEKLLDQIL